MTTRVIANIGELTTNDAVARRRSSWVDSDDAALVIDDSRVLWVGANARRARRRRVDRRRGAAVMPGFVDSHTHLVFAGERSDEFEARMAGAPYDGGGIARPSRRRARRRATSCATSTERRLRECARRRDDDGDQVGLRA